MKIRVVVGVAVAGIVALGSGWVLLDGNLGWWDPIEASTAQKYYLDLIAGIASSLHNEVVIMGLFVVLMTHAGESVLGLHPREKGDFLKILVILLFVILFASYYAVTYSLDLEQGSAGNPTRAGDDLENSFLPILMIPIDLAAIGLSIAIMVSLASERVLAGLVGRDTEVTTRSISEKLMVLMSLTARWHLLTVLWRPAQSNSS